MLDLLWQQRRGELPIDVAIVISNHSDLAEDVPLLRHTVRPHSYRPGDEQAAEQAQLELLRGNVDLIVLARYMEILKRFHSTRSERRSSTSTTPSSPAFIGARAYQKAEDRGVEIVGATAHYVTAELDQGPIISSRASSASTHSDTTPDG